MTELLPRDRPFPPPELDALDAVVAFLGFVHTTAVNKATGLTEAQARSTPLESSPAMSVLGVIKHLTAVQRQHVQIHIGGADVPSLWRADDLEFEFRIGADESIESVVAAFDAEWETSRATLARLDLRAHPDTIVTAHGRPVSAVRLLVDVLQESARHLGHIDILRETIDGATGE